MERRGDDAPLSPFLRVDPASPSRAVDPPRRSRSRGNRVSFSFSFVFILLLVTSVDSFIFFFFLSLTRSGMQPSLLRADYFFFFSLSLSPLVSRFRPLRIESSLIFTPIDGRGGRGGGRFVKAFPPLFIVFFAFFFINLFLTHPCSTRIC